MYYKVKEQNYWVEVFGTGEPVVFLHGFTGSTETWRIPSSYMNDSYQHILIDLPGHGKTEAPYIDSIKSCCYDLRQIFHQLKLSRVHLVGYSLGGRTALSFAVYFPEFIASLLLESATPGLEQLGERKERQARDQELANFIENHPLQDFVDRWESIPLFESQKHLPLEVRKQIRHERMSQSRKGLAQSLRTMGTGSMPSWWSELSSITCPVLLIVGELDQKFVEIAKKMEYIFPNSTLQTIFGCGHAVHVEQPKIFGTIVNDFINQRRSSN
ncbi:2-succinyl-6-hydroxy-2,4-cyclohexadiene-1-carboxylate synthase [Gracilibacillus sp. YIM 98692]|uniref:2-succinyl-6-hydroxy-2, 4-cyclohexadiene-1-carboxylate synthase n=1 Tax=Gracilibacillus sp. YIM 98692 TaxID=2663532 RepID=UPI0013D7E662|nr:2-succinyl-6-hydroxy-2,4-cyclohexadiene-1-carboxylate synthase [Gracilibacillus sp. YIM 98692]